MRAAPAVRVTVQPPAAARVAVALLAALAAAAAGAWWAGQAGAASAWGLLALLPGAALGWWQGPAGAAELAWDGQQWHLDGQAGGAVVHLDLQSLLLLRWTPAAGRPRWLLAHRRAAGGQWHALRVALFAGHPLAPTDAAGQPPLTP